jgi:hypothetical protein
MNKRIGTSNSNLEFNLTAAIDGSSNTQEDEHRVEIMHVFIEFFGSDYEQEMLNDLYSRSSVEAAIRSIENAGW